MSRENSKSIQDILDAFRMEEFHVVDYYHFPHANSTDSQTDPYREQFTKWSDTLSGLPQ